MGRIFGFLKRHTAFVIAAIAALLVLWGVNDARTTAHDALAVAGGFEPEFPASRIKPEL